MNTKRKCQVVMLPTNGKALIDNQLYLSMDSNPMKLGLTSRAFTSGENFNKIPQHLYITSNEEIKEGDWIQRCNEIPVLYTKYFWFDFGVSYNKIIATTDISLQYAIDKSPYNMEIYGLPQLSQQFIEDYIKEYNKGNIITDVEVEYESRILRKNIPNDEGFFNLADTLNINPDNTINIKLIKDSWSREEIKFIATRFAHECRLQGVITNNDTCNLFDKWIEENL